METDKVTCPKCGIELPIFNEKGQHNFCPTLWEKSKTVDGVWHPSVTKNICMKCKMKEIVATEVWQKNGWR